VTLNEHGEFVAKVPVIVEPLSVPVTVPELLFAGLGNVSDHVPENVLPD
jgi:hypothetical protein